MKTIKRVLVTVTVGAVATVAQAGAAIAAPVEAGHWSLDENPALEAVDSSGNGNHGTNYNVVGGGDAYTFNGLSSRVVVRDSTSLDPGAADFSFGVMLSMELPPPTGETQDALRKGLVSTPGGNYKLEIKHANGRAVARCVVKDSVKVIAAIQSQATVAGNLADGDVHTVTCKKTATGVTVTVDALAPRTKSVTKLGSVSNTADLAMGAKAETTASTGFDWFLGKLHDVWVTVG